MAGDAQDVYRELGSAVFPSYLHWYIFPVAFGAVSWIQIYFLSDPNPDSAPTSRFLPDPVYLLNIVCNFLNLTLPLFCLEKLVDYKRNSFLIKLIHNNI
jgi:hypothetical protein